MLRNLLKTLPLLSCLFLSACGEIDVWPPPGETAELALTGVSCTDIALQCVMVTCTTTSPACLGGPSDECLKCVEKARTGALCKYFFIKCRAAACVAEV